MLSTTVTIGEMAVGGVAAGGKFLHVVVDEADAAAAALEILSGAELTTTARTISGAVAAAGAVAIESIVIVQETALTNGRRLILFSVQARNAAAEALTDVAINVSP